MKCKQVKAILTIATSSGIFPGMKKWLIAAPITLAVVIGGVVVASPDKRDTTKLSTGNNKPAATTTADTPATEEPAITAQPSATATPTQPAPTATAPAPAYGELPDHPGIFAVFDKKAVMDAAGVPVAQQADAEKVINKIRGEQWIYKMSEETNVFTDDLFRMTPPKPQDPNITIPSLTDYRDSPVEQLRLANYLANEKYTGWTNVLEILNAGGTFTR